MCATCLLLLIIAVPGIAGAQISLSPDPLAFGAVRVDNAPERDIALSNAGVTAIAIDSCAIDAPAGDFSVTSCPATVPAGGSALATVRFRPQVRGAASATLRITYAAGALAATAGLTGRGVAPDMLVTVLPDPGGSPIDFGAALAGTASPTTYTFRVENGGDARLDAALAGAGSDPGDWSYAPGATSFSLAAGETRDLVATFTPAAAGGRSATVSFTDLDGLSAQPVASFALAGTGRAPALAVSPLALEFGSQSVGTTSAARSALISNQGDADLTITAVSVPGARAAEWPLGPLELPATLAPGEALAVPVRFAPAAAGARDATLAVATDSPVSPASAEVALLGDGTGAPGLTLSPTALTFGAIDVQTGGAVVRTLTVGNTGNLPLAVTALRLAGLDGGPYGGDEYALSPAAPLEVPAGGQVTVDVTYRPRVESAGDYAVLVLETDSPEAPVVEITLSGRGLDRHIAVSQLAVRFPDTYRNPLAPAALPLEVSNTGESPLRLDAVMLEGDGGFALAGELPEVIAPFDSATVELRFAPPAAGALAGALLLVNDDDQRPMLRVDLAGAGVLPPIRPSLAAIDYGSATVELEVAAPGERYLTLVNTSEVDSFTVKGAQVTGPGGELLAGFDIHGLRHPVVLDPGGQMLLEVVFHPHRAGDFGGTLEILVDEDPLGVPLVTIEAEAVDGSLRGSGCSAGGGAPLAGALAVLLAALALGRRRAALAVLLVALAARAAAAQVEPERQTRNLDLATFRPAHSIESGMLTVDSPAVGQPGAFSFDAWIDYARNPLVVEAADGEMVDHPIANRATLELAAAYAFGGRFEVSGALPVLSQGGSDPQFSGIAAAEGSALGDLRLRGKAFLLAVRPLSFGASAEITLPTGSDDDFAGAQGPSAALRLLSETSIGRVDLAANAGALMRQRAQLADVEQGHQFLYGLAGAYRVAPRLAGIAELFGAIDIGGGPAGGKPLEAALGARYHVTSAWALVAGGGRGLLPGIGSPELRVFAAVAFAPRALRPAGGGERLAPVAAGGDRPPVREEPDADRDGLADLLDRCPERAEDRDGYQDDDGCPEIDNDRDSIADDKDRCRDQPEDADGFADDDGCPDPDNDRDGVFDAQDQCPAKAETINGNADDDGCPDKGEALVFVTRDRIELFEPIRFKGDSAELTRPSIRLLGQVGATLRANPDIVKLHIRAHVDRRGGDDDQLSVRRAEAVRRWLVEWGIAADRLEGVGFGSRFPLGKGRALNDRIELEIKQRQDQQP